MSRFKYMIYGVLAVAAVSAMTAVAASNTSSSKNSSKSTSSTAAASVSNTTQRYNGACGGGPTFDDVVDGWKKRGVLDDVYRAAGIDASGVDGSPLRLLRQSMVRRMVAVGDRSVANNTCKAGAFQSLSKSASQLTGTFVWVLRDDIAKNGSVTRWWADNCGNLRRGNIRVHVPKVVIKTKIVKVPGKTKIVKVVQPAVVVSCKAITITQDPANIYKVAFAVTPYAENAEFIGVNFNYGVKGASDGPTPSFEYGHFDTVEPYHATATLSFKTTTGKVLTSQCAAAISFKTNTVTVTKPVEVPVIVPGPTVYTVVGTTSVASHKEATAPCPCYPDIWKTGVGEESRTSDVITGTGNTQAVAQADWDKRAKEWRDANQEAVDKIALQEATDNLELALEDCPDSPPPVDYQCTLEARTSPSQNGLGVDVRITTRPNGPVEGNIEYTWKEGHQTQEGEVAYHTYFEAGTFTIKVKVNYTDGSTSECSTTVVIELPRPPVVEPSKCDNDTDTNVGGQGHDDHGNGNGYGHCMGGQDHNGDAGPDTHGHNGKESSDKGDSTNEGGDSEDDDGWES